MSQVQSHPPLSTKEAEPTFVFNLDDFFGKETEEENEDGDDDDDDDGQPSVEFNLDDLFEKEEEKDSEDDDSDELYDSFAFDDSYITGSIADSVRSTGSSNNNGAETTTSSSKERSSTPRSSAVPPRSFSDSDLDDDSDSSLIKLVDDFNSSMHLNFFKESDNFEVEGGETTTTTTNNEETLCTLKDQPSRFTSSSDQIVQKSKNKRKGRRIMTKVKNNPCVFKDSLHGSSDHTATTYNSSMTMSSYFRGSKDSMGFSSNHTKGCASSTRSIMKDELRFSNHSKTTGGNNDNGKILSKSDHGGGSVVFVFDNRKEYRKARFAD